MRSILIAFLAFFTFDLLGQNNIKETIVGEWTSFLSGDSISFRFNADGSMFIATPNGIMGKDELKLADGRTVKSLMRYVINPNVQPIQIDFYFAMDNYFNVVGKSEGIVEVLDDNLLRFAMNHTKPPVRPKNFDNPTETAVLIRRGKTIEITGCDRFKKGNFKMTDAFMGTVKISREKDFQFESNELGDKVKLKIEWTSDCTYTLTPLELFVNNKWIADTTGVVQTIQIIKTKKDSYIFSASSNVTKYKMTRELFMTED